MKFPPLWLWGVVVRVEEVVVVGGNIILGEIDTCDASYASIEYKGERRWG